MGTRTPLTGFAAGALVLLLSAPMAASAPAAASPDAERPAPSRRALETELPNDGRPIVATVIEIDEQTGMVTLDTPHGPVELAVTPELVERLSIGDVVVVRFTDEDADSDYPSASPRETPPGPGSQRI
ncbi:MAG: hypothetical protein FJ027_04525 [Candidatus Rokubacteria bacterium]|nr:hypothetical protein [Candidatus Rokubacteria bacterium]